MKAIISLRDPKVDLVVKSFGGGSVVSMWDEDEGNIELNLSLHADGQTGNPVVEFVSEILQKAGIENFSFKLKKTTTVEPVVQWDTANDGYQSNSYVEDYEYDEYMDYANLDAVNLDYLDYSYI